MLFRSYEIASLLENIDNARYQTENFTILKYWFENYNNNDYITEVIVCISKRVFMLDSGSNFLSNTGFVARTIPGRRDGMRSPHQQILRR